MIAKFSILILFLLGRFIMLYEADSEHRPLFVKDGWDFSNVETEEFAFSLMDDSTLVEYQVLLLEDEKALPVAYSSSFTTPVCDDSLCALLDIRLYWNLLGNYIGYDTIAGHPLTKNDHLKFREEDYIKLHRLLMDDNSIIKRKEKKELFDDEKKRVSSVVEAVTGATSREVKEAVVDGALYSSYTLYHIVYGSLSDSILSDMESRYSIPLQNKLLSSSHSDYQLYALKRLSEKDFFSYEDRIVELIHEAIPLNRLYIMKKMPGEMWKDENIHESISGFFEDLDGNTRTYFLRKMASMDRINPKVILDLVSGIGVLSQNQLKILIQILEKNTLNPTIIHQIKKELSKPELIHGYLFNSFMEKISEKETIEN